MYSSTAIVYLVRTTKSYAIYQSADLAIIHYEKKVAGRPVPDVLVTSSRTPTAADLEAHGA